MSILNFIIVALFNIYWAIRFKREYLQSFLFRDSVGFSIFIWLYAAWGIINLVMSL